MANICTNLLHCSTRNEQNYNKISSFLTEELEAELLSDEGDFLEAEFGSKWTFPESCFEELFSQLEIDDTLYMRILSYEFTGEYVSLRFFRNGEWEVKV